MFKCLGHLLRDLNSSLSPQLPSSNWGDMSIWFPQVTGKAPEQEWSLSSHPGHGLILLESSGPPFPAEELVHPQRSPSFPGSFSPP